MDMEKEFASGKHLKADMLGVGAKVVVQIAEVKKEKLGEEAKPVVYFAGKDKGLPLNRTNLNMLIELFGPESDDWIGQRVVLYTTTVDYAGKRVLGVRLREAPSATRPAPPVARPAPEPARNPEFEEAPTADEIPF